MKKYLLPPPRIRQILFGLIFCFLHMFNVQAQSTITECNVEATYTVDNATTPVQNCSLIKFTIKLCNQSTTPKTVTARFSFELFSILPVNINDFIFTNSGDFYYYAKEIVLAPNECKEVVLWGNALLENVKSNGALQVNGCSSIYTPIGARNITITSASQLGTDGGTEYIDNRNFDLPLNFVIKGIVILDNSNLRSITTGNIESNIYLGKGAKLIIKNGSSLALQKVNVQGCAHQWESIEVGNGSTLIMNDVDVKDAEIAVNALNGSNVSIVRTNFEDNKISIKATLSRSIALTPAPNISIAASTFKGTGSFKPRSGLTLEREQGIPDAGIVTTNLPNFSIVEAGGSHGIFYSVFQNLKTGIIANNSHVFVRKARFLDIQNEAINFKGRNHKLTQLGLGDRAFSDVTFQNCNIGIAASGASDVSISNNLTDNLDIAFQMSSLNATGTKAITQNYIKGVRIGIKTQFSNLATNTATISKNKFFIDYPSNISNTFGYQGFESATSGGWVVDNNGFVAYKTTGIAQQTSGSNTIFRSNEFFQDLDFARLTALRLSAGNRVLIGCNNFVGYSTSTTDTRSISATSVSNTVFSCNAISGTNTGFEFNAANGTTIRGNEFSNQVVGVKIREFGFINTQRHNGNVFIKNCDRAETGVYNENPIYRDRVNSQFVVDRDENPNFDGLCPNDNNDGAFQYTQANGTTFSCSQPLQDCPNGRPGPLFFRRPIDPSDIALIKGDWNAGKYTNAQVWQGRYHLYRRLKQDPDLAATAAEFQAFLANFGNTSIGQLYKVEAAITDMQTEEYQKSAAIEANLAKMASIETEITAIDEQMNTATGTALSNLLKTRRLKINNLETYQSQNEQIADNIAVWKAIRVTEIYGLNDIVNADEDVAEYLKTTNKIALESIHRGQSQLNEAQEAAAYAIATLCPLEGGDAVFEARSLLSLNTNMSFDDETICVQSGKQQTIKVKEAPIFKLSPNPAYQELYIDFEGRKANEANLRIANAFGQVVAQHIIKGGSNYLDIADLPAGVYYLTVEAKEQRPQTQKLIIVK